MWKLNNRLLRFGFHKFADLNTHSLVTAVPRSVTMSNECLPSFLLSIKPYLRFFQSPIERLRMIRWIFHNHLLLYSRSNNVNCILYWFVGTCQDFVVEHQPL